MDFQHWLYEAENVLYKSESPRQDAEVLLSFVTGKTKTFCLAFENQPLTTEQEMYLSILIDRRKSGEPIAYLTGEREFWSLPLYVSSSTLIPRPDTECLVEQALLHLSDKPNRILDLGTGTGAISIALASERPDCNLIAVDLISESLMLVRRNLKRLEIRNVCTLQSFWFSALYGQKFEMIVSNPPYIDAKDPHLLWGDVRFEPLIALVASDKGMANLNHIILHSRDHLKSGGWLLLEHGWKQGKAVREYFIQLGYQHVQTYHDYGGNERLTLGKYYK